MVDSHRELDQGLWFLVGGLGCAAATAKIGPSYFPIRFGAGIEEERKRGVAKDGANLSSIVIRSPLSLTASF